MKLDLKKAYDCVDWSFMKLILLQVGMSPNMVEWIMSVVSTARFDVIINETPTEFFCGRWGLR